ncbi:acyl-CoA dehydrogenase [Actinomadura vinacea]|uniref:Acyl-CoA dehydrogenase n=1 Tax=Actinomadura vinacea TaxID=115336 RepID=A0ABN3ISF0_9ACTN
MDGFTLTPDQQALREVAAKVAADVYAPVAADWDLGRRELPAKEVARLAGLGFLGIALPERYGGAGGTLVDALIVIEELAKVCRPAAFQVFEANVGPARVLEFFGTEEQCERLLPGVVGGEVTMAIGISEPDAGSAATDMRTKARPDGDEYVITGSKRWISGGGHATHYLLYCRLSDAPGAKGIGAIIVPADAEGMSYGEREKLMGWRGIPSADVILDEVRVPKGNLVVPAGGFKDLFGVFSIERLGNSTMSLAIGQAALDRTCAYVQERLQFGRPIVEFQNVHMTVAEMAVQVEAARLLIWRAAAGAGRGLPDPLQVSMAKCFSNEMAKKVSDLAMQLHGGNGYTEEFGIEALHRDAHGWAIAGGTPAIQRVRIASELFGRSFDQRPAVRPR